MPYDSDKSESESILTLPNRARRFGLGYHALLNGLCLEDIELRRNGKACWLFGSATYPDPRTSRRLTGRFDQDPF